MPEVVFDFTQSGAGAVSPGCHDARIRDVSDGIGPSGQYLALTWEIDGSSISIVDIVSLSPNAAWKAAALLTALGTPPKLGEKMRMNTDDWLGRPASIHVDHDRADPMRLRVVGYELAGRKCWRCTRGGKPQKSDSQNETAPRAPQINKSDFPDLADL